MIWDAVGRKHPDNSTRYLLRIDALARQLRRLKSEAGLSFSQLAERCWCSRSSLERYLNGRNFPPREVVRAIGDACGGDTDELLALWESARAERDDASHSAAESLSKRFQAQSEATPAVSDRFQPGAVPRPRQLPLDIRNFTGRDDLVATLDEVLAERAARATNFTRLAAIVGTAGVGKTALATHWAHRVADQFPDGQLWINLHGYDPYQTVTPVQALGVLLRALGVPGAAVPPDEESQSGLFRSLLADRRILLVLDNVYAPEQVRPLLPGGAGCLVLVTSRHSLTGLVARDGATRLKVDRLSMGESVALLRRVVGPTFVDAHSSDLQQVVNLCAYLPLALRIAAERMDRGTPGALITELTEMSPLDAFAVADDSQSAIRAVFSWSYRALPPEAAALFRRLGTSPLPDYDEYLAAAAMGTSLTDARRQLAVLADAHLVESRGAGRVHMHDLLRAFAVECAEAEDPAVVRRAAVDRVLDYYRRSVASAVDLVFPNERRRTDGATSDIPAPSFVDSADALAWLDGQWVRLLPTMVHAATEGWYTHAVDLSAMLYRYLVVGAHHGDALTVHRHALAAAEATGDRVGLAAANHHLGSTYWLLGEQTEALEHYGRALDIFRELGDSHGAARALGNLGNVFWRWGRNHEAYRCYREAQAVFVETGDVRAQAMTLLNLSELHSGWGQYEIAFRLCEQALELNRSVDEPVGEAISRKLIGDVHLRYGRCVDALREYEAVLDIGRGLGHHRIEAYALDGMGGVAVRQQAHDRAVALHEQALSLREKGGDQFGEVDTLALLATAHHRRGDLREAADRYQRALAVARALGRQGIEPRLFNGLGEVALGTAGARKALSLHERARKLAVRYGDCYEEARARLGLAHAHVAVGNTPMAIERGSAAYAIYARLALPEADEVRSWLRELSLEARDKLG